MHPADNRPRAHLSSAGHWDIYLLVIDGRYWNVPVHLDIELFQ
jgi:hypothetical protein